MSSFVIGPSSFVLRHSFVIRHSSFVILCSLFVSLAASAQEPDLAPLVSVLAEIDDAAIQRDLLQGMREGVRGRKEVAMPSGWPALYARLEISPSAEVREHAQALGLLFGDPRVLKTLKSTLANEQSPLADRAAALTTLLERRVPNLAGTLQQLLGEPELRGAAIRGLAAYADDQTPSRILAVYPKLTPPEQSDAIATLSARPAFALALLDAVAAKHVRRTDISAYSARQLAALGDERVTAKLRVAWGEVRETSREKQSRIEAVKIKLTEGVLSRANAAAGRAVFVKSCQTCHTLFGEGAKIGPDLTGSNRAQLDYILSNIFDPSAEIGQDYQMKVITTESGRTLTGLMVEHTPAQVVVQTATERLVLGAGEVSDVRTSPLSMMPEGLPDQLTFEQLRDLVAYLARREQVPIPSGNDE